MTKIRTILAAGLAFAGSLAGPAFAQQSGEPACAGEASKAALKLLKLHSDGDDRAKIDGKAHKIGTIKPLRGKGAFDVLEIDGYIYKGEYRIRLIYAQIPGTCALMGQEILERGNPY